MSITPFIPAKPIYDWGGEDVREFFIMNKQQYISNSLIVRVDNLCVSLITQWSIVQQADVIYARLAPAPSSAAEVLHFHDDQTNKQYPILNGRPINNSRLPIGLLAIELWCRLCNYETHSTSIRLAKNKSLPSH